MKLIKNFLSFTWEIVKVAIIALIIVIPIRYFLFQPFLVRGISMEPNFEHGDYLIVDKISYRFRAPKRGEVVVLKHSERILNGSASGRIEKIIGIDSSKNFLKRIIGLPGETIEIRDGQVIIYSSNNKEELVLNELNYLPQFLKTSGNGKFFLEEDQVFVLGDNRLHSTDSRRWGGISQENVIGRVFLRVWPFANFEKLEQPQY